MTRQQFFKEKSLPKEKLEIKTKKRFGIFKSDMQNVIIKLFIVAIKIPFTKEGFKECWREKSKLKEASVDYFYHLYVPSYNYLGNILVVDNLNPVSKDSALISGYFKEAFKDRGSWNSVLLENLIEKSAFTKFLENHLTDKEYWLNIIKTPRIPSSSCHGDFHIGNIGQKNGRLFFIDWSNYRRASSRYFDLLDFCAYNPEKSWVKTFFDEENIKNSEKILGEKIPKEILIGYAVWRAAKDIRELIDFGNLNPEKIRKHKDFLLNLKKFIENKTV